MEGWLNTDLLMTDSFHPEAHKRIPFIYMMDATVAFPFQGERFSYIYCEDFIEHFSQMDGLSIATECYWVLKPGGVWRISPPCFDKILSWLDLSAREKIDFGHWRWGHKLLYTEGYARSVLGAVGFGSITNHSFGESDYNVLRGIDTRDNQKHLNLIIEAVKPTSS